VPKSPRPTRQRRALSIVGVDALPEVQVVDVGTVPMTEPQHAAAVHALAVLIAAWRDTRPGPADQGRQAA
jgi:hypothetical protein